jgi:hypothetical protein
MKAQFSDASELDGYEELQPDDQERVKKAYEDGHVAPEDVPESAKKPAGEDGDAEEDEDQPKKKSRATKKKDDGEEKAKKDDGEKPKRARATKKVC